MNKSWAGIKCLFIAIAVPLTAGTAPVTLKLTSPIVACNFTSTLTYPSKPKQSNAPLLLAGRNEEAKEANASNRTLTEVCMGCLCQAVSGCKQGQTCDEHACGLFHITQSYWNSAGKVTLIGQAPDQPDAYSNCVMDPVCAAVTVRSYMQKFGQDCNGDGQVSCYDYIAIHKLGPFGCTGPLPYEYLKAYNLCIAAVTALEPQRQPSFT